MKNDFIDGKAAVKVIKTQALKFIFTTSIFPAESTGLFCRGNDTFGCVNMQKLFLMKASTFDSIKY